jgi:hypothetical protein
VVCVRSGARLSHRRYAVSTLFRELRADLLHWHAYPALTRDHFDPACQQLDAGVRVVLRNRGDVRPKGPQGYEFAACVAQLSTSAGDTSSSDTPPSESQPGADAGGDTDPGSNTEPGDDAEP